MSCSGRPPPTPTGLCGRGTTTAPHEPEVGASPSSSTPTRADQRVEVVGHEHPGRVAAEAARRVAVHEIGAVVDRHRARTDHDRRWPPAPPCGWRPRLRARRRVRVDDPVGATDHVAARHLERDLDHRGVVDPPTPGRGLPLGHVRAVLRDHPPAHRRPAAGQVRRPRRSPIVPSGWRAEGAEHRAIHRAVEADAAASRTTGPTEAIEPRSGVDEARRASRRRATGSSIQNEYWSCSRPV